MTTPSKQQPVAADLTAVHKAIDAFENRERGLAQAHIAARLVAEIRASLGSAPATPVEAGQEAAAVQAVGATQFSQSLVPIDYATFFYELGALMGIGAQNASPETVWREQMLPTLQKALAVDATTGHSRAVPVAWQDIENQSIGRAINRAAAELPAGAQIRIELERDAGTVYWLDRERGAWRHIDSCGEPFSSQIDTAIDAALSGSLGDGGGKG